MRLRTALYLSRFCCSSAYLVRNRTRDRHVQGCVGYDNYNNTREKYIALVVLNQAQQNRSAKMKVYVWVIDRTSLVNKGFII